ncbi:hypothetical protein AWB78_08234 [Caballeronia calidae]|uniref:Polysaccharide biosynthesis protein n=1 Tax=Caballeronia calidae TaxID=1777139 RepID=A0A158EIX5_9BURK|nr:hypothetical protein [Caballeronia calidae]SAL06764.1 hypothetical protein AWB78_08234 [Caballeronia calidae]
MNTPERISQLAGRSRHPITSLLALRVWQAGAGLVTTLLAAHAMTPELQGWYYSLLSVASLYTLFDLGLSTVLVQLAAHSFIGLRWTSGNRLEGETQAHFKSLLGKSVRWYAIATVAFLVLLLPGGWVFFSEKASAGMSWKSCWFALCTLTAGGLIALPFLALVEGSGEIAQVYRVRLTTSILGSLACWAALVTGSGLWAVTMMPAMALCVPLVWLACCHRPLVAIARENPDKTYRWRQEVWPLQWRLAINWLCGYSITQINIPILFNMQGAIVAGQFGLSLTVVNTIGLVAQSWLLRRVPGMANAAATRDWRRLDRLFLRDFSITLSVCAAGVMTLLGLVWLMADQPIVHRLLPWPELLGLAIFACTSQFIGGLALQLRSFRREPLVWLTLIATLVTVPAALYATRHYSSAGLIAVLAGVNVTLNLPASIGIWYRCNRIWRATE